MDWTLLLVTMLLGLLNYIMIDQAPEDANTPTVRLVLLGGWALVSVTASLFVPTIYAVCREPMLPAVIYGGTLTLGHAGVRRGLEYCRTASARRGQRAYAALTTGDTDGTNRSESEK